ncbi:MAG TPA: S41 family peptidase [Polyangiaceae bacterium]
MRRSLAGRSFVLALSGALAACSQQNAPSSLAPAGSGATSTAASTVAVAAATSSADAGASSWDMDDNLVIPPEKFSDPQKAFALAKEAMLNRYYAAGLTEEDLYRAAVRGMLSDVDPAMHKWNKLLSPGELAELNSDLKGEIVGIGVRIRFDAATGHILVLSVIPGTPADKAGVHSMDLVLSVNGKHFKAKGEMGEMEALHEIRGKAGEPVTLSVLRDDTILPFSIVRAKVTLDDVRHQVYGGLGYLSVLQFSERTTAAFKQSLDDFAAAHVSGIALDLRHNSGGSFDEAVKCAELLLPAGSPIVTLERRNGKMETFTSKGSPAQPNVPVVVLVDHATSSGAELVTAALAEQRKARSVGMKTFGKWSVQFIEDLPNGYAIKYTSALFHAPSGKTYQGEGMVPDVEVDESEDQIGRALQIQDLGQRAAVDPQLRTAFALLKP